MNVAGFVTQVAVIYALIFGVGKAVYTSLDGDGLNSPFRSFTRCPTCGLTNDSTRSSCTTCATELSG
ncbi:MAG: hypothetical protein SV760_02315 [Halobacteria archaeon]|nr:hypothetical protein [Halobacteria archaeon]